MPLLFVVYWWRCVPKGTLRFKHIAGWVIYPLVYFGYVSLRGHMLGQYQYPFMDVDSLGYPQVFVNAAGILAGFIVIALAIIGLDKHLKSPRFKVSTINVGAGLPVIAIGIHTPWCDAEPVARSLLP